MFARRLHIFAFHELSDYELVKRKQKRRILSLVALIIIVIIKITRIDSMKSDKNCSGFLEDSVKCTRDLMRLILKPRPSDNHKSCSVNIKI